MAHEDAPAQQSVTGDASHWTAESDVIWNSPSKDSSGSMPLGNGEVGINLGVENGGDGFTPTDDRTLSSSKPTRAFAFRVAAPCLQTKSAKERSDAARKSADSSASPAALKRTLSWWRSYWNRSWVIVGSDQREASPITRGYSLQRYVQACGGRGTYPIKFNGGTVTRRIRFRFIILLCSHRFRPNTRPVHLRFRRDFNFAAHPQNYVLHLHTWSSKTLCYLEDIFVSAEVRGKSIGHALIARLADLGRQNGWGRVYWHTNGANVRARRLYDRFVPASDLVHYVINL